MPFLIIEAATNLREYTNLEMLCYSLNDPTLLSNHSPLVPGSSTSCSAKTPCEFKILSGGASLCLSDGALSYLSGSFPNWEEYNTDALGVVQPVVSNAFAIGLNVELDFDGPSERHDDNSGLEGRHAQILQPEEGRSGA